MKAEQFGPNLKEARTSRFMSQLQLALKAKVTQGTLARWESSETYPNVQNLIELCEALDMSPDDLLSYTLGDEGKEE